MLYYVINDGHNKMVNVNIKRFPLVGTYIYNLKGHHKNHIL